MELGADAKKGPTSSPVKRRGEGEGDQNDNMGGATKKRRKKTRKHEVLEEGWGEHIVEGTRDLPEDRELGAGRQS